MRMRYRYVAYRYIEGSQTQLEHHYRQLVQEALRQNQHALLQHSQTWRPFADIVEATGMMTVKIELAGMKEEDIEVTLYEDALVISGQRHNGYMYQDNLSYHEAQIRYGPFRVTVFIPCAIERDTVTAHYENGFLTVNLPKVSTTIPASIQEQVPMQRDNQKE